MAKAKHPHDKTRPLPVAVRRALAEGCPKKLFQALTPRQRRFAEEYVIDFSGKAAAIRAGYAVIHADKQASTLVHHEGVAKYIDHLMMSREAKIAAIDPDYVIQKVTEIVTKEGAKDGDKLRGLELLARHLGMFVDRTELTGKDGGAIEIENRKVEEDAESFTARFKALAARAQKEKEIELL